jgi:hypothetical protein
MADVVSVWVFLAALRLWCAHGGLPSGPLLARLSRPMAPPAGGIIARAERRKARNSELASTWSWSSIHSQTDASFLRHYLLLCPVDTASPTEMHFCLCTALPHRLPARVISNDDLRLELGALASGWECDMEQTGTRNVGGRPSRIVP